MKKLECPHCGFIKVLGGRELRTFRKRLAGFTCTNCGKKVSSHDLAKKRGKGPKPPGERRKRMKKEVAEERPKAIVPQPYVERPGWGSRPLQPTGRTLEEAVITSLNIKVSAPIPTLTPQGMIEEDILTEESPRELDMNLHSGLKFLFPGLRIDPIGTVEHLPKDARLINRMQTNHLKEQLKGLDGYNGIEGFRTVFAEFSALKNKSYGNVFYFSASANPWERVYRVTVDDSLTLEMKEPIKRLRGWGRSIYDPIIDRFIECGHDLVKIVVEGRKPGYIASQLRKRIKDRELKIAASSVGDFVYLENNKRLRLASKEMT